MFATTLRTTKRLPVRTTAELDAMREAGRVVASTLAAVSAAAQPGARLRDLDDLAKTIIREAGALPSFLGYAPSWAPTPFNGVLCLSPNEAVVHGRPSGRRLRDGDLLSVDCGAIVPNQPQAGAEKIRLQAGNTIAIEPMLLQGSSSWRTKKDGWPIVTADKRRAAHVEHTVAVTDDGAHTLTVG